MDINTQIKLSQKNNKINQLYIQKIRQAVNSEYQKEDELAIHRKAIADLYTILQKLCNTLHTNAEFDKYNKQIEQFKQDFKIQLNIQDKKEEENG